MHFLPLCPIPVSSSCHGVQVAFYTSRANPSRVIADRFKKTPEMMAAVTSARAIRHSIMPGSTHKRVPGWYETRARIRTAEPALDFRSPLRAAPRALADSPSSHRDYSTEREGTVSHQQPHLAVTSAIVYLPRGPIASKFYLIRLSSLSEHV